MDKITIPVWRSTYVRKDWVLKLLNDSIYDDWEKITNKGMFNVRLRELIVKVKQHNTIKRGGALK